MLKNFRTRDEIISLEDFRLFDVRFQMNDLAYGQEAYDKEHGKGAAFLDLAKDLSGEVKSHGGRHPLPEKKEFQGKLRQYGLEENQKVLIYDDGDNLAAGRLWWLLKYYGFTKVYVLLGGFSALKSIDVSQQKETFQKSTLTLKDNPNLLASYEEVKHLSGLSEEGHKILVDSRDEERYQGIVEPIDTKKGHIPGAINVPYKNHFADGGHVKEEIVLHENFKELPKGSEVIFYCGSGVTACSNIMVYEELGNSSRLYSGSFSDYISYDENQVVKK